MDPQGAALASNDAHFNPLDLPGPTLPSQLGDCLGGMQHGLVRAGLAFLPDSFPQPRIESMDPTASEIFLQLFQNTASYLLRM